METAHTMKPGPAGVSTVRVSVDSGGGEGNGDSAAPSVSADGRHVAFVSLITDLLSMGNDTATVIWGASYATYWWQPPHG